VSGKQIEVKVGATLQSQSQGAFYQTSKTVWQVVAISNTTNGLPHARLIIMVAVFVLAPKVDDLRLLPLDKIAAKNIYAWILAISGVGLLGYLCVDTLNRMAIAALSLLAVESI
jgi:hypothetical protein